MFLINRSIINLEGYEVMALLAAILNKHIGLAGRQMPFASKGQY